MLARLEGVDGLSAVEVDHRGELLRLAARDRQAVADAVATLRDLGYGADELGGPVALDRWYGRETVEELSREEGRIIAERVVHPFTRARQMDPSSSARLEEAVARALGGYFAAHSIDRSAPAGSLREDAIRAAHDAAAALIGVDAARDLAGTLRLDLEGTDRM